MPAGSALGFAGTSVTSSFPERGPGHGLYFGDVSPRRVVVGYLVFFHVVVLPHAGHHQILGS